MNVARLAPWIALAALVVFEALLARALWRAPGPKRAVLVASTVLASLPALYIALVWAGLVEGDWLRFARPWGTLVGAGASAFIGLRLAARPRREKALRTALFDLLVQTAALCAMGVIAGPELGRPLDRLTVLVAVDRSRSIDRVPNAEARVRQELSVAELGMRADDRVGTVVFAAEAATEDPPRQRSTLAAPQRMTVGRDASDLGAAIRRALSEIPPDSAARVALLSDGVATRGDAMAAAARAAALEVPIDVLPLEQRSAADVRLVALRAPSRANEGEAMDLGIVTSSSSAADVEIILKRDGVPIAKASATVNAGEDVLRLREKAPGSGLHRYDVEIHALSPGADEAPDDNDASAFVRVRGASVALVLEGDRGEEAFIAGALSAGAFRVDHGGVASFPTDLAGLAAYDLVVLSDLRASDLSTSQLEALASYVRDLGGGLVLFGGDRSMGPGGYARTPIEEISPVSFDLKQEERRASLAEVIGIDISGSMGAEVSGHTKLELANEAAVRSASLLGAGDRLGVEHVDTKVVWSVPLGPVTDKAAIERAIRGVGVGGGGIYVDITLDAAYAELDRQTVNLKHVLLFADGSDAEQMAGADASVAAAQRRGITTSVIALGTGSDVPGLEKLSRLGGGRFYLIEDATKLPSIFAQETILASRSAIVEKPFSVARGRPSSVTAGIPLEQAPQLGGYVVTLPKSRATVLATGPEGDPILATWSAGVGRVGAFTSDLKSRWGRAWTEWPSAARLVVQLGRDVTRKTESDKVRVDADASGGELRLRASVLGDDGHAQSFRRLAIHVAGPDGFSRDLALEASGAGAYAASMPLTRQGTYVAVARDEETGDVLGTSAAVLGSGDELRPTGSDLGALAKIADISGGKRRETLAGIFEDRGKRKFAYEDITATLAMLAALGLLFAVAARRLGMPEALAALVAARAKARGPSAATVPSPLPGAARTAPREAPGVERAARPVEVSAGALPTPKAPSPASPNAGRSPEPNANSVGLRKSAAEILAERKRKRGG